MKNLCLRKTIIGAIAITVSLATHAQFDIPKYEFGLNVGFLVYQGDLTPEKLGSFKTQKLSLGLHASRLLSHSFSVRANLAFGKLVGDEAKYNYPDYRKLRSFYFTTPVIELSALGVWNIIGKNYADKGFSPYLFAGVGLTYLKIKRDWSNINTTYFNPETSDIYSRLAVDSAHALPSLQPVIPMGAGVKYFFNPNWAINVEAAYRFTTTDYLDGFSQSVNPKLKDSYLGYNVGVIYRSGKKNRLACPIVKY